MDLQEVPLSELECVEGGGGTDGGTNPCVEKCKDRGRSNSDCKDYCKNAK